MSARAAGAAVLGSGAWGTTLANVLAENGGPVALWARDPQLADALDRHRENRAYLAGVPLHPGVRPTPDLEQAVSRATLVLSAVPSHGTRDVALRAAPALDPRAMLVSASKGIENGSLLRVTEVLEEVLRASGRAHGMRVAVLSGPSFAREVGRHRPTAVTLASRSAEAAGEARARIVRPYLRVYTSEDVVGVELGGALKNVIAIAAGIAEGLGAGQNGRAALITRGMAEIFRLGRQLGAEPMTLSGLAGMGDLILTCTSTASRNYRLGLGLGKGGRLEALLGETREVAEGVLTSRSAYQLARREGIEMPIVNEVYAILHEGKSPAEALGDLMSREMKTEFWW
ncbi:MAG: NAD(P)H-dependent glycerol-3-phosphate dehydrogenase [Gemmatimonadota bacterium]